MSAEEDKRALTEILARALSDYAAFCRTLVWLIPKDTKRYGLRSRLRFKRAQAKYNANRTARDVVLKGRQVGMTTEAVARDVFKFLQPSERVVVVVQSVTGNMPLRQTSQMIRTMLAGLIEYGVELKFGTESESLWTLPERDSRLQIIEAGASLTAAQKKGRGGTYTRVHVTEAAFFEHAEATTNALFEGVPALPGTEIEIESTANGTGNWFHNLWVNAVAGKNGFTPHFIPWFEDESCELPLIEGEVVEPENEFEDRLVSIHRVSPQQLKFYREKVSLKGTDLAAQEYPSDPVTAFLTSGKLYFDVSGLNDIAEQVCAPPNDASDLRYSGADDGPRIELITRDDLRVWEQPAVAEKYVFSIDPAEGLGESGDWTFGGIFHRKSHGHIATFRNKLDANAYADAALHLAKVYNDALIVVERNKGLALIRALERLGYSNIYYDDEDGKPGIATTSASKPVMLEELGNAIRDGSFKTRDEVLVTEMRAFVRDPRTGKPHVPSKGTKNGTSDDGIMMAALAWRAMLIPPSNPGITTGGPRGLDADRGSRWRF